MRFETGTEKESDWLLTVSRLEDSAGWMDGWMDGWTDGRMGGWMVGWMDGWMDGWFSAGEGGSTSSQQQVATVCIRHWKQGTDMNGCMFKSISDITMYVTYLRTWRALLPVLHTQQAQKLLTSPAHDSFSLSRSQAALRFGCRPICRTFVLRCLSKQHVCPRRPFIEVVIVFAAARSLEGDASQEEERLRETLTMLNSAEMIVFNE